MQQTAVAVAVTKDQVTMDLQTTLACGSSYFFCAVVDAATDAADSAMTAACGSSSCCSAVADAATMVTTTTDATKIIPW